MAAPVSSSGGARSVPLRQAKLKVGDQVTFDAKGNARGMVHVGMAFDATGGFAWTTERFAGLDIPLETPSKSFSLTMSMAPFLHGARVVSQEATIYVNGLLLGYCTAAGSIDTSIEVEPDMVRGGVARLRLLVPTAVRPRSVGAGADERLLGFRLTQITLA